MGVVRWLIVTVAVIVLTTVGINAADNLDVPGRSLLGAAVASFAPPPCPDDMALVLLAGGDFCVDRYEAAAASDCPVRDPENKRDTDDNLSVQSCEPVSEKGRVPWRNISRQQAELACARAGKRLPTNNEWYRAALGTPDKNSGWGPEDCNVENPRADAPDKTGSRPECVSAAGAFDMIGNTWEWLEETVEDGVYVSTDLPFEGFITDIDSRGIPHSTDLDTPDDAFFRDYFWLTDSDVRGMLRGGYWLSRSDAGQYALNVTVPPSFIGTAVGFRCVKDAQ